MKQPSRHDDARCLTEEAAARYRIGGLSLPEAASMERHAEGCPRCASLMLGGARIIPFPARRGGPSSPEPAERPAHGHRGVAIAVALVLVFSCGAAVGRLVTEIRRPDRVLSLLAREITPRGLHLGAAAEALLTWRGAALRLSPQAAPDAPGMPTASDRENSRSFSSLDRRWVELATLEAIEQRPAPDLLQGFAYLTAAHARSRADLLRARDALGIARELAPKSSETLNDLAVVTVALYGAKGVDPAWELLERALEIAPLFPPALYNQAVLARGRVPLEDEERFVIQYLDVEGGSAWAASLHARHEALRGGVGYPAEPGGREGAGPAPSEAAPLPGAPGLTPPAAR